MQHFTKKSCACDSDIASSWSREFMRKTLHIHLEKLAPISFWTGHNVTVGQLWEGHKTRGVAREEIWLVCLKVTDRWFIQVISNLTAHQVTNPHIHFFYVLNSSTVFFWVVYFTPFLMSPVDRRCPWWVHGFVWNTSLPPWRLPLMFTLDSPLFLWCAHFFFLDASAFMWCLMWLPPHVLALYVQTRLSCTLIFIGPVSSADMIYLCRFISSFFSHPPRPPRTGACAGLSVDSLSMPIPSMKASMV